MLFGSRRKSLFIHFAFTWSKWCIAGFLIGLQHCSHSILRSEQSFLKSPNSLHSVLSRSFFFSLTFGIGFGCLVGFSLFGNGESSCLKNVLCIMVYSTAFIYKFFFSSKFMNYPSVLSLVFVIVFEFVYAFHAETSSLRRFHYYYFVP